MRKVCKRKWTKWQKSVYVKGRGNFIYGNFIKKWTKQRKNVHLYIVGDEIFVKKFKIADKMGKKCPVIWCRVEELLNLKRL